MDSADQIYRADDNTALRFYTEPTKNNFQSEKHGRPIFDTSLMVEVMTPGSTESVPKFEVERTYCEEAGTDAAGNRLVERTQYYARYERQVEAFKQQSGNYVENGTPINQWPQIDAGTAATLKAAGIHSVEMLAGVSDGNLPHLGHGGRVLREQAQAFLNSRTFGMPTAQMAAETANLRDELERTKNERDDYARRLQAALAENNALRLGNPPPIPVPGGPNPALDPLGPTTPSQPDPFASLDSGKASPLVPDSGGANERAQQRAEADTPAPQPGPQQVQQQPQPGQQPGRPAAPII